MRSFRSSARLARSQRLVLYAVGVGVWASGVLWLVFHYALAHEEGVGPLRHPLESWSLTLHGGFAVAATWTLGWLWSAHIARGWSVRRRRFSGSVLAGLGVWLVVSGYLLYYLGDERLRSVTGILHWATGTAIPLAFFLHRVGARSLRRAREPVHRITRSARG